MLNKLSYFFEVIALNSEYFWAYEKRPDSKIILVTRNIVLQRKGIFLVPRIIYLKKNESYSFKLNVKVFPNNQNFNKATEDYNDFIQKITIEIDKVAPIKERR